MPNSYLFLKKNLFIAICVYTSSIVLSSLIFFVLNLNDGNLVFKEELGQWYSVFLHNVRIHIMIILSGILFSIPSILILIINGSIGGFFITQSILTNDFKSLIFTIFGHGLFEIPATLMSAAMSFQITALIIYRVFLKKNVSFQFRHFLYSFLIMIVFTLISSLIETY